MRRLTHYDYWSDGLKPSILADSAADLLVYGMGEKAIVEILSRLAQGANTTQLHNIPQTAYIETNLSKFSKSIDCQILNSFETCLHSKRKFGENFKQIEQSSNSLNAKILVEPLDNERVVVVNPPYPPVTTAELDGYYDLPYTRLPHPRYKGKPIPAWEMIKHSLCTHRGCFGGCAFCTISAHQGRKIVSRSEKSILHEIEKISQMPDYKAYISDLGGPSANMYGMEGQDLNLCFKCKRPSCIYPSICNNLNASHQRLNELYAKVRELPFVKKAFVSSGVRYDLFIGRDSKPERVYFENLCRFHVSGRLKVAPEHTAPHVLKLMRKPPFDLFKQLKADFELINHKYGMNQQLIPYFISSHPACTEADMHQLMVETKALHFHLEQVQDFTPTPMTLSSTIYYTGLNPYTNEPVYVAHNQRDKLRQRDYFFWYKKRQQK